MTYKEMLVYAKRGILSEIDDWKEKKKAVASMRGTLSDAEIEKMMEGMDNEIEGLTRKGEELTKEILFG